jgi:hypothetical protein
VAWCLVKHRDKPKKRVLHFPALYVSLMRIVFFYFIKTDCKDYLWNLLSVCFYNLPQY